MMRNVIALSYNLAVVFISGSPVGCSLHSSGGGTEATGKVQLEVILVGGVSDLKFPLELLPLCLIQYEPSLKHKTFSDASGNSLRVQVALTKSDVRINKSQMVLENHRLKLEKL